MANGRILTEPRNPGKLDFLFTIEAICTICGEPTMKRTKWGTDYNSVQYYAHKHMADKHSLPNKWSEQTEKAVNAAKAAFEQGSVEEFIPGDGVHPAMIFTRID